MDNVESLIIEALNLTKDSISDAKVIFFSLYMKLNNKRTVYIIFTVPII